MIKLNKRRQKYVIVAIIFSETTTLPVVIIQTMLGYSHSEERYCERSRLLIRTQSKFIMFILTMIKKKRELNE